MRVDELRRALEAMRRERDGLALQVGELLRSGRARSPLSAEAGGPDTRARDLESSLAELARQLAERDLLVAGLRDERAREDSRVTDLEARVEGLARERDLLQDRIANYKRAGLAQLEELRRLCAELARRSALTEQELRRVCAEFSRTAPDPAKAPTGLLARLGRHAHGGIDLHPARGRASGRK